MLSLELARIFGHVFVAGRKAHGKDAGNSTKEAMFKALFPRDGCALSPNIRVFNHVWVDKESNGVAKSRLTCADVKQKQTPEQRLISQGQSNFCPTPHPVSLKILEAYALLHKYPPAKTELTSSFLIARDGGDIHMLQTAERIGLPW